MRSSDIFRRGKGFRPRVARGPPLQATRQRSHTTTYPRHRFLPHRSHLRRTRGIHHLIDKTNQSRGTVPQGSCLSPTLYLAYTDDLPVHPTSQLALFADDITLMSNSLGPRHATSKLQRLVDVIPDWLTKWRLRVNVRNHKPL